MWRCRHWTGPLHKTLNCTSPGRGHLNDVEMPALDWGEHSKRSYNTRLKSNRTKAAKILCCKETTAMSVAKDDGTAESFWEPGQYRRTVRRFDDGHRLCNDLLSCFQERSHIEKQYAQQLTNWSQKWKTLVDKASSLNISIQQEKSGKLCWLKLEIADWTAPVTEKWGHERYEKALEELNKYNPKYMEDMEQVFDSCQDFERKRLRFFKDILLEFHKHLDVSSYDSFQAIYRDLYQIIASANDQEDLRWWQNTHGPGMTMNWPQFEEWAPEANRAINRKEKSNRGMEEVTLTNIIPSTDIVPLPAPGDSGVKDYSSDWSDDDSPRKLVFTLNSEDDVKVAMVRVRALYDYAGQEADELSFSAGQELMKIGEEDEQGWCKGQLDNGQSGLYPANYAVLVNS
ncbi:protein kinase C and casein kinase II substrate protein 3-like [Scyliorhinus torazame]